MKIGLWALVGSVMAPLTVQAQDSRATIEPIPQIAVTGRGEVKVSPDRATIQVSVQTRAVSAAAAASENATKQQSVLAALRILGLQNDQLSTINYNVYPEQRYEQGKEPVIVAYNVTNTILVDVRKLNQVGPVIDASTAGYAAISITDESADSSRRPHRSVERREQELGEMVHRIEAAEIGRFYRPRHGKPSPDRVLDHAIDRLRRSDTSSP